jgi:hypothetical protein
VTITSTRIQYATNTNTTTFFAEAAGTLLFMEARKNNPGDTTLMTAATAGWTPIVQSAPGQSSLTNERCATWWKLSNGVETSVTINNMAAGVRAIEIYKVTTTLTGGAWRVIHSTSVNSGSSLVAAFTVPGFKSPCEENVRFNQFIWSEFISGTVSMIPLGWTLPTIDIANGGTARVNLAQDELQTLTFANDSGATRRWTTTTVTFGYVVLPSIAVTSPAAGAVSGTVTLESSVTGGNVAIARTRFFRAGTTQVGTDVNYARRTVDDSPTTGKLFHVLYVLASDSVDRRFDLIGNIWHSVQNMQTFLTTEIGKNFRVARTAKNQIHVTRYRTSRTIAAYAAAPNTYSLLSSDLVAAGFNNNTTKNYLVYFEGRAENGAYIGQSTVGNLNESGIFVVVYLQTTSGAGNLVPGNAVKFKNDADTSTYWADTGMLHELFHSLGAVPLTAPNIDGVSYHTLWNESGGKDVMGGNQPPRVVDLNRNDYYAHSGSQLDTADAAYWIDPAETPLGDWQGTRFVNWNADAEAAGSHSITSQVTLRDLGDLVISAPVVYTKAGTPPPVGQLGFDRRNSTDTGWNNTLLRKRTGSHTWE